MKHVKAEAEKSQLAKLKRMTGGHADEKADRSLVKKMVKPAALSGKAGGGTAKKKIAPSGPSRAATVPGGRAPVAAGVPPRLPSPAAPAGGLGALAAPAGGLGALAGAQPPIGVKGGGKVKRAAGGGVQGYDAGAMSGEGRLEKEEHMRRRKGGK